MISILKNHFGFVLSLANRVLRPLRDSLQYIEFSYDSVRLFRQTFQGKDVALVGNGINLVGSHKGGQIDGHEVVIRFNIGLTQGREQDLGSRTDIRFLGLTLKDHWIDWFESVPIEDTIWTLKKNQKYLKNTARDCLFLPSIFPQKAILSLYRKYSDKMNLPSIEKTPRSGIVFLSMLLCYGSPARVTLYGFAQIPEQSLEAVYNLKDGVIKPETDRHLQSHCDPLDEIRIMHALESSGVIQIE